MVGGRAEGAGLDPRGRSRRPAHQVRAGARGGALPVARLRPDRRQGRGRHRRHLAATREAPREFTEAEVDVLVSSASLVAGAIENARLYEETRRRVDELEHLTELGETIARAETLGELLPAVAERARAPAPGEGLPPLPARPGSEELHLRASAPRGAAARAEIGLAELGPELARSGRSASVAVPLVANDELLGLLTRDRDLRGRPRPRGREPDRGGDQEDRADRAADGEEPDQGLLRAARGRGGDPAGARGARRAARLRPRPAATSSSPPRRPSTSSSARSPPRRRAPSSTAATTRCAPSSACPPTDEERLLGRSASCSIQLRVAGLDRHLERLPRRRELRRRLRGGAARAARDDRAPGRRRAS